MRKGDIFFVDLKGNIGSEQGGNRPVVVLKTWDHSPFALVACMTTSIKTSLPVHLKLYPKDTGLRSPSVVLLEQILPVLKSELKIYSGKINHDKWRDIEKCLKISLGL